MKALRILIDQYEPKPRAVKRVIVSSGHEASSVYDAVFAGMTNGTLLAAANDKFDVLLTVDTNLRYQQNITGKNISVVVIRSKSNRTKEVHARLFLAVNALNSIKPGQVIVVGDI